MSYNDYSYKEILYIYQFVSIKVVNFSWNGSLFQNSSWNVKYILEVWLLFHFYNFILIFKIPWVHFNQVEQNLYICEYILVT